MTRYVPKWVNGFWVVFDRHAFKHIYLANYETEAKKLARDTIYGK